MLSSAKPFHCSLSLAQILNSDTPIASLSLAQMQLVEIAKALSLNARLVIMDEPTSSLTARETVRLLEIIKKLKSQDVSVIFITHRLAEVESVADRVVVLRDGRTVAELHGEEIQSASMIRYMIGRDLKKLYRPPSAPLGPPLIELTGITTRYRPARRSTLRCAKERYLDWLVWLAPGAPNWRERYSASIHGLDGEIRINGREAVITSPRDAIDLGVYLVPEDRKRCGLILDMTIRENITLTDVPVLSRSGLVDEKRENDLARAQMRSSIFAHPTPSAKQAICPAATNRKWCWPSGFR